MSNMWIQATQKQLAQLDLTKYSRKVVEGKCVIESLVRTKQPYESV